MNETDPALAERLAREAGDILLRHRAERDRLIVTSERAGDFVSEADRDAEDHLRAGLVLLREAGARVEGWTDDERPEDTGTVLTATPALFPEFAACIRRSAARSGPLEAGKEIP